MSLLVAFSKSIFVINVYYHYFMFSFYISMMHIELQRSSMKGNVKIKLNCLIGLFHIEDI